MTPAGRRGPRPGRPTSPPRRDLPSRAAPEPRAAGRPRSRGRAGRPGRPALAGAFLALLVVLAAVLGAGASPAAAHAVLVSSSPGEGERLPQGPSEVSLVFSEEVDVELGGIQVLDSTGARVDVGAAVQPSPSQLQVDVAPDLGDGTYLVSYRVVSDDGHPINGAVVFAVGDELDEASVAGVGTAGDTVAEVVAFLGRFLTAGGALLAVGLAAFVAFVHDGGPERRRLVALSRAAGLVAAVAVVPLVAAQVARSTGRGLGAVTDTEVLGPVLRGAGFGWSVALLLAGLALVHVAVGSANPHVRQGVVLYGGLLACGSFALWGHSTGAEPALLAGVADALHVSVAALWLGGLVGLALTLTGRAATAPDAEGALDSAGVVLRFSNLAAISVLVLWVSGVVQAQTLADLPGDLTATTWGRWLLAKTVLVAAVLVAALWNRRALVPRLLAAADTADAADAPSTVEATTGASPSTADATSTDPRRTSPGAGTTTVEVATRVGAGPSDDGDPDGPGRSDAAEQAVRADGAWSSLRRSVLVEVAVLVVVVALTGMLVDTPPGTGDGAGGVFEATVPVDDRLVVALLVSPAATGRNSIHVTYQDAQGRPADGPEPTLRASLVEPAVGPVEITASKAGPGHYVTATDALSVPGTWELELITRLDEFTAERNVFQVPVGSP